MDNENLQQECERIIDDLKNSDSRKKEKFKKVCKKILFESNRYSHKQIMKGFRENIDPSHYITFVGFTPRQYQPLERMLMSKSDDYVTFKLLEEVFRHDLKYLYNFLTVMIENSQKDLFMGLYEAALEVQASQDEVEPVQEVGEEQGPVVEEVDRQGPVVEEVDRQEPVVEEIDRQEPVVEEVDRQEPVVEEDIEVAEASSSLREMQLTGGEGNKNKRNDRFC